MLSLPIFMIELKIAKCMKREKYILQCHSNKNKSILIKQSGLSVCVYVCLNVSNGYKKLSHVGIYKQDSC